MQTSTQTDIVCSLNSYWSIEPKGLIVIRTRVACNLYSRPCWLYFIHIYGEHSVNGLFSFRNTHQEVGPIIIDLAARAGNQDYIFFNCPIFFSKGIACKMTPPGRYLGIGYVPAD